jgi:DNA invertase Pin-like site-specific DNA recombinase
MRLSTRSGSYLKHRPKRFKTCLFQNQLREGDTLVVRKLDRLARSVQQLIETVVTLEAVGGGLRSLTEQIDTTTRGERLVFHIFGAMAEFERSRLRERTMPA